MLDKIISKTIPLLPKPLVKIFASKYIAGEEVTDAVALTQKFMAKGGKTTIDVLGEYVTSQGQALKETAMQKMVVDAIDNYDLDTYLSVKPTSIGMGIDKDFGYENVHEVISYARSKNVKVRLDMENSPYTSLTLDYYRRLREAGFDNVGFVVQAYLKRTLDDLKQLKEYKPDTRLCKGIYVESDDIALKDKEEIRNNYKILLDYMLDNGYRTCIATHDEPLIDYAEKALAERDKPKEEYEFQMLLGVREQKRDELIKRHPLRIYIPFGRDWYGYSIRRFNENPQMAKTIAMSFVQFWKK